MSTRHTFKHLTNTLIDMLSHLASFKESTKLSAPLPKNHTPYLTGEPTGRSSVIPKQCNQARVFGSGVYEWKFQRPGIAEFMAEG